MSKRLTLGISKWLPSAKDKITCKTTLRPSTPNIDDDVFYYFVKAALQRGADVNTKSDYGLTGLMHAVRHNCNSVVALLLKTPNIDVNQRDDYRRCALHWAVTKENNEVLKLLLNAPGVDVNIVDNSRKSVLLRAVLADNINVYFQPMTA